MQLLTDRRVVKFHKLDPFRGRTRALPYRSDNLRCFLPHESCSLESSYAGSAKIFCMIPESDFINASNVLPSRMLQYWHRRATEQSTCRRCNPCAVHARISDPLIWRIIPILHPYQSLKLANDYSSCRICAMQGHLLLAENCPLMQTCHQPFLLIRTGFPLSR